MTGRERVDLAFAHREPDRVPCYEQSIASDVSSAILGREAFTGTTMLHYQEAAAWMRGDDAHAEFERQLYDDILAITDALGLDLCHVPWRRPQKPAKQLDEWTFVYGDPDGAHTIWRYNPEAKTYYHVQTAAAVETLNPDALEPGIARMEELDADAPPYEIPADDWHLRMKRERPDLQVTCPGGLSIPLQPVWLMACALRPDLIERYLDQLTGQAIRRAAAWAAQGFTIVWGGGDLADNSGPVYGPAVFRELVMPRVRRYTDALHELGMLYVYRTDGNLWPIADEFFIGTGSDGFGEIDYDAGMKLPELMARYGERITFWGDVPCGSLLHRGTPEQVREFVKRRLAECRGAGGWILGSSNSIVPGTPPENVVAMFETAQEG